MMEDDGEFALHLAVEAGKILIELRNSSGLNGKTLGEKGDFLANEFIISNLKKLRPNDGILSEEEKDNFIRLEKSRVWIIDPLDGTLEYSQGRNDFAVHIALAIDGKPKIGAVALPALQEVYTCFDSPILKPANNPLKIVVSRTRAPKEVAIIAEKMNAEIIPMGSAGFKAMAIIQGKADIYFHSGGQYEWDNCAPVAVALGAGLHASRIDGSQFVYNNKNTLVPDLLICRRSLAPEILSLLKA